MTAEHVVVADTIEVEGHMGRILVEYLASTYPYLGDVILEGVQNSIDGKASHISVMLNRQKRTIAINDNGNGVSPGKMLEGLKQIGMTMKSKGALGEFGLGFIAGLGKCREFTFTSRARGADMYYTWTMNTAAIKKQAQVTVPQTAENRLRHGRSDKSVTLDGTKFQQVTWNSRLYIKDYTNDKVISRIGNPDELAEAIFAVFGSVMSKRGIKLSLVFINEDGTREERRELEAPTFTGDPLPPHTIREAGATRAQFNLFLALSDERGRDTGIVKIKVGDDEFDLPFAKFADSVGTALSKPVLDALNSGIFEGYITTYEAKLHQGRKNLVRNTAFLNFCHALERWYDEVGQEHIEKIKAARKDERLQRLGMASMRNLQELFQQDEFQYLRDIVEQFKKGTVGEGHKEPEPEKVLGQQPRKSLSIEGDGKKKTPEPRGGTRREPKESNPDHHPLTVAGPDGQNRTIVRDGSFGLQFVHAELPGSDDLWKLDDEEGILYFNIRHHLWVACDAGGKSDRRILQLQEIIAVHALQWFMFPDDQRRVFRTHIDDVIETMVHLLQHSPSFNVGKKLT